MDRRRFAAGAVAWVVASAAQAAPRLSECWADALKAIEAAAGGVLGVWAIDTATGQSLGWRAEARFAQCSTFKLSLAACVLRQIERGAIAPGEILPYAAADLLPNSPITGQHVAAGGMTVLALAEAAQKTSDNLAANLLLRRIGGPPALTAFWRSLGDATSRLDRFETALNRVEPGERHDTVTPRGIAGSVARIVAGDGLEAAHRTLLLGWMRETATGVRRIRAGLPGSWVAGDKAGTANYDTLGTMVNDIAVAGPAGRKPLVIAAFYRTPVGTGPVRPQDEAVLASVGALVARWSGV